MVAHGAAMLKPDIIVVDGHTFGWQRLCELWLLMKQAAVIRAIHAASDAQRRIAPGMRALDLGCGTGDVVMLTADLVSACDWARTPMPPRARPRSMKVMVSRQR